MIFSNEILLLCSMYIILKSELYNSLSSNKDLTTFSFFFFHNVFCVMWLT